MCKTCGDLSKPVGHNAKLPPAPAGIEGTCRICHELPMAELGELNLLMGDPKNWPVNWAGPLVDSVPRGLIPPQWRLWGAIRLAKAWAADHRCDDHPNGHKFHDKTLRVHYHRHVYQLPENVLDVVATGAQGQGNNTRLPDLVRNPMDFRRYMAKGLEVGYFALDEMHRRVAAALEDGEDVPDSLLLKLADMGQRIASSQASLVLRGMQVDRDRDAEIEGFRAGAEGLPSPRYGHSRIRTIEGVTRPVVDEGRADRNDFNERSRAEGGPTLPA